MEAYRIVLTSWTASFRCPNIISGVQLSLEAPPISTIYGLLSASTGEYISPKDCGVSYCYRHTSQAFDLETIYKIELNKGKPTKNAKSDIVRRQVLFDNVLILYVDNEEIARSFLNPAFPLLLGRSGDLATVERLDTVELHEKNGISIAGTVFPMKKGKAFGTLQALPTHFSNTVPRQNISTQPFYVLKSSGRHKGKKIDYLDFTSWVWDVKPVYIDVEGYNDSTTGIDLWWFRDDIC